jgi:hypothetical protein
MYTVEFEEDASVIISLDEDDKFDDVELVIGDDGTVFIRQFEEEMGEYQLVTMSYQQLLDLYTAFKSSEGLHQIEVVRYHATR